MSDKEKKPQIKPFHEEFAENIIAKLETGTAPWQKPWKEGGRYIQHNPASGTVYKGVNRLQLAMSKFSDPRWMTFNQAADSEYQIKKGSKSTTIVFYQFHKEIDKLDDNGKIVLDDEGKAIKEKVHLERPIMRLSKVFNAEQIEGIPPLEIKENVQTWEIHQRAEQILQNSHATIKHDQADRAFYRAGSDEIHLPPKENFPEAGKYYSTALHELGHWTGHPSRLDRTFGAKGTPTYAKEELRAEISSWMLGDEIGIGHDPDQHTAYVASWIQILKDEPLEIMRACKDAEKAKDLVMGFEKEIQKEQTQHMSIESIFAKSTENIRELQKLQTKQVKLTEELKIFQQYSFRSDEERILQEELQKVEADISTHKKNNTVEMTDADSKKFYLDVPYDERKEARMRGASWDEDTKQWYITNEQNIYDFKEWRVNTAEDLDRYAKINDEAYENSSETLKQSQNITEKNIAQEKTFLSVPFEAKEFAKKNGAKWDKEEKSWFAPIGTDLTPLQKWLPEIQAEKTFVSQEKLSAEQEFAQKLEGFGFELNGLPIMDGTIQRVPLQGRGAGNRDGAYCGYSDGIPAGWAQDYSTGEKIRFVATGHVLSDEEKAHQQAERAQKLQERENERLHVQNEIGDQSFLEYEKGQEIASHPYLENKGIEPVGIRVNEKNQLLIPVRNTDEQIRGIQYINEDGSKYFKTGMEKKGNFCMINPHQNDPAQLGKEPAQILICEGYATAVSLHEATGLHVAVAFDSGNLEAVAKNIRARNPNSVLIICADNDHSKEVNVGLEKATITAKAVYAILKTPAFTLAEKAKGLTDFNDLHKSQGIEAVKNQLGLEKQVDKKIVKEVSEDEMNRRESISRALSDAKALFRRCR